LIGDTLVQQLFPGMDPSGRAFAPERRIHGDRVIEKIAASWQDQDNFIIDPLPVFLRIKGAHSSLTIT